MWFCGIDIGTTHIKVVGINEEGTVLPPLKVRTPVLKDQGHTFHTGEDIWKACGDLVTRYSQETASPYGPLAALSVGTFGQEESLAVDAEGATVFPSLAWWEVREHPYLTATDVEYLDSLEHYQLSGLRNRAIQSPERMAWIRSEAPEAWKAMKRWVDFGTLILYRLTGEWAFASNQVNHSQFFSAKTLDAHQPSLDILGLTPEFFAPVQHTGTPIGKLLTQALPEVDLAPDATAYMGGHDQVMALYSQRGDSDSTSFDSIGTSEYLMVLTDTFNANPEAWKLGLDIERSWTKNGFLYGFATPSGKVIQTIADLFYGGDYNQLMNSTLADPITDPGFRIAISDFSGTGAGLLDLIGLPAGANADSVSRSIFDHLARHSLSTLEYMASIARSKIGQVTLIGSLFQRPQMVTHRRSVWNLPLSLSDLSEPVATGTALVARHSYMASESGSTFEQREERI